MTYKLLAITLLCIVSLQAKADSAYLGAALSKINDCYYRVKVDHKDAITLKTCNEAEKFLESNLPNIKRDMNNDKWTQSDSKDLEKLSVRHKEIRLTLGTYRPQYSDSDMKELGLVAIYGRFCEKAMSKDKANVFTDKNCKKFLDEYVKNHDAILKKKDSKEGFTEVDVENWSKVSKTYEAIQAVE